MNVLVGVGVVLVVLDAPGLKGEDNGCKHKSANDIFDELVLAERTMTAIMTNNKPLQIKITKLDSLCRYDGKKKKTPTKDFLSFFFPSVK